METNNSNDIQLKFGNQQLQLKKSKKYIGVKPQPGAKTDAVKAAIPEMNAAGDGFQLGGFQLLNIENVSKESPEATLDRLRMNSSVRTGTHVFHTSNDEVPFVPTGQIYIECSDNATLEDCEKVLNEHHLQIVEARGEKELIVQVTPESLNPVKVAAALQQSPFIKVAEPELATPAEVKAFTLPVDERIKDQWHLRNTGTHRGTSLGYKRGADARVMEAWDACDSIGSPNVILAVIDDGFDLAHPDLSGTAKIVAPMDFTRNSNNPVPDPLSEDWHGTACAGVAIGNAEGTGIVGAAPKSRFMPIRWGLDLSDRQIEAWFRHPLEQGAWVVSCSWGAQARNYPLSTRAFKAIQKCAKEGRNGLGTVICFAAGNENRNINAPASQSVNGFAIHPDVIAVAACTSRDERSSYSNFGKEISVSAPSNGSGGWGITTSDVMGQFIRNGVSVEAGYSAGAYTDDFGGTSSACPLVAGICAFILSVKPELTYKDVRSLIQSTARKIGSLNLYDATGHSLQFGYGCIDTLAAVTKETVSEKAEPLWGKKGHELVNELSVNAVPGVLQSFYKLYLSEIVKHAMDADDAKQKDPEEKPRHFIDIDMYGEPPFSELPEDRTEAEEKFGAARVLGWGIVPWQIEITYNKLVAAFKMQDRAAILEHSAWLGHYVGDAHVPFHTTANHDGQLTSQKGLHSYFESQLLDKFISPQEVVPNKGMQIKHKPHKLAFQWVRESYGYLKPLLDADAANGGKIKKRNIAGFAKVAKPIAIDRLKKGCCNTASLWYSAWVESGSPSVEQLIQRTFSPKAVDLKETLYDTNGK